MLNDKRQTANGKQGKCIDTCPFLRFSLRSNPKNGLLGQAAPNPATSGHIGPKSALRTSCCVMSLSLHFLVFTSGRQTEQLVDIGLYRNDFLHVFSCLPVCTVSGFFLGGKLPTRCLEGISFGKLRPGQ